MSKDNEKKVSEKKDEKVVEKKKEKEESKKDTPKKLEVEKDKTEKKKNKKKINLKKTKRIVPDKEEVITEDSPIREKVMILGRYLLERLKDYRFVILLEVIVYLLLFFLIPKVIFDVKPFVWMTAFVLFTVLPTIGIYGMNKFRDKQIIFSFVVMYLLILLFIKRFALIELYGITSHGNLDHTPAWLDAVFVTCIIVFFQYIGVLIVNVCRKLKKKNKKKSKKNEK